MLLDKKSWTYEQLAEKADISRDAVSKYVSGKSEPKLETLIKIAQALDTSIDNLVGIDRRQEPTNARQEAKVIMENLFLAYNDASLSIDEDAYGRICLVVGNSYIADFIRELTDKGTNTLDDVRSTISKLYEGDNLVVFNGEIMPEEQCKKRILEAYIEFSYVYAHYNDLEGEIDIDENTLTEKFHEELEKKKTIDEVLEWGNELQRKRQDVIDFHSKPFHWNVNLMSEWNPFSE